MQPVVLRGQGTCKVLTETAFSTRIPRILTCLIRGSLGATLHALWLRGWHSREKGCGIGPTATVSPLQRGHARGSDPGAMSVNEQSPTSGRALRFVWRYTR